MALLQFENAGHDLLAGGERARDRPPALLDQAGVAVLPVAANPLVPRLPGDPVLPAQRRHVRTFGGRPLNEIKLLAHGA
jgi:hypothetical protein